MAGATFLQIFLFVNVFLIGAAAAIAAQHAYAHFKPRPQEPKKRAQDGHLPPEVRERLLHASQANFQAVLERSASQLQHDLDATTSQLNKVLQKIGSDVVGNEMERYRLQLEQIRKQATGAIDGAQAEIDKHQAELMDELSKEHDALSAKLAEEIAAEKQRHVEQILAEKQQLMQQIDTKLADAMASFLLETLGHNVDLGAQNQYLLATLEEHKEDFKRGLSNDA